MEHVALREFQKKDTPEVIRIIRETWHYDAFCSPKAARKLATVFLYSCLTNQTYTQVALQGGRPVGIIMGNHIKAHRCPLGYRIKQIKAILSLYFSAEGRKVCSIFKGIQEIDQQLLQACKKEYAAELAFFAVSADVRGTGVGKKLFHSLLEYMKSQKIGDFYLFTDTSCNYGFYEHQGMTRRGKIEESFPLKGKLEKMEFYLYDGVL